jgi:FkbH-like protein
VVLRRSRYVHLVPVGPDNVLAIHAVSQHRMTVTAEVARLIARFDTPCDPAAADLAAAFPYPAETLRACVDLLFAQGILTEQDPEAEAASVARELGATRGRDPLAELDRWRRAATEGGHPYWAVTAARTLGEAAALRRRVDALLFGDCDVQMEADFLRREAAARGIDLHVAAAFSDDVELARERRHDVVIIGALQARHAITLGEPRHHDDGDPARVYVDAARTLLEHLRAHTDAPILLDGLAEPTVQPLGFADHGIHSHRNRFRRTNLGLQELADAMPGVHLVDVAATLGAAGSAALLDDGLVSFTHFGSPGWMLQRPPAELVAVHDQFPDMAPLAGALGGDPYRREAAMARAHMDAIAIVLGLDRRKCVIVDLDGVLWPGVLAETGSPFAWSPDISSPNSYIGLFFGIHEALLALRRRGVLLACVSKNDAATVRALWDYPPHYPAGRLLTLNSFVTTRINWEDKAENIRSIADELGFALDAFVFIDDSPRERERVRQALPEVAVLGEDLFALRRALLTDPGLQPARLTAESAARGDLVKAQLDRARLRDASGDKAAFVASLDIEWTVARLAADAPALERVAELFERTTQFNANGRRFGVAALRALRAGALPAGAADGVFALRMRDRFGDSGLVGAAVVSAGEILNVAISCRVIGLGGELVLLDAVAAHARGGMDELVGRIVETARNLPARHLYRDAGFAPRGDGWWGLALRQEADATYRLAAS